MLINVDLSRSWYNCRKKESSFEKIPGDEWLGILMCSPPAPLSSIFLKICYVLHYPYQFSIRWCVTYRGRFWGHIYSSLLKKFKNIFLKKFDDLHMWHQNWHQLLCWNLNMSRYNLTYSQTIWHFYIIYYLYHLNPPQRLFLVLQHILSWRIVPIEKVESEETETLNILMFSFKVWFINKNLQTQ